MRSEYASACVTGGAGFIGSHLVRALRNRGMSVTVLDNLSVGSAGNVPAGVRFVQGDILDTAAVTEALSGADVVFHLAARVAIRSSFEFAFRDAQTNFSGTASVLECVARSGGVKKVVFTSSMAVYAEANSTSPISEDHRCAPISAYGISKLAAEQLVHSMCRVIGVRSNVVRLFNTYGAGQTYSPYVGVVTIFVNKLLAGEKPTIFGDGEQSRDFVHLDDVVEGLLQAMELGPSGETFNIGSGVPHSVNAILGLLNCCLGTNLPAVHVDAVPGELRYSTAGIGKAASLIGYRPRHRLETSICDVVSEIVRSQGLQSKMMAATGT